MAQQISPDYLVIGAGAMGMAFADTILSDTDKTIAIVDRYAAPGGHWTIAYPFVRLHQPSAFYGVNSRVLGEGKIDQVGWNKGLAELASVDEVCAYYKKVLQQTFLPSGRVAYYPKHDYTGNGGFRDILTGKTFQVGETTKIVDATYMKVKVPAMAPPSYEVASDVKLITPNALPDLTRPYGGYTVVGAGKTGIDACLWLLDHGISPQFITWIIPRDSWFLERAKIQPDPSTATDNALSNQEILKASSPEDLLLRLEKKGNILRLNKESMPTMYRCATISHLEFEGLQKIPEENLIRQGRVVRLTADEVFMEHGTYTPVPDTLYIDCTADGLAKLPPRPIFSSSSSSSPHITLQPVRFCQQVFSAALIAHVEATYSSDQKKNGLCEVVPHPDVPKDYLLNFLQTYQNTFKWALQPQTTAWLDKARLDWYRTLAKPAETDEEKEMMAGEIMGVCRKLEELLKM